MADSVSGLQAYKALAQSPQAPQAPNVGRNMNKQQIQKVAKDFEAVFISQMLKPMFQNVNVDPPFGGGSSEKIWRDLQVDEYGKAIAKNGGIGLADSIVSEMLKMQEAR